jgi:ferrous iron transport protein B
MRYSTKFFNHPVIKILVVFIAIWLAFNAIFFLGTNPTHWIDGLLQWFISVAWKNIGNITVRDFVVYGLITGIGGFLVYVPNIVILFLFSNAFFDTGVSHSAARIVDPFFRFIGLDGYSFQPLIFGFGCSVNAIQSAHFIENKKSRLVTMLIAPFMSCGSKFGVYVLIISVVFPPRLAGTVLFGLYFLGITFAFVSAAILRMVLKIKRNSVPEAIPSRPLTAPNAAAILKKTLFDAWIFCWKAGGVIVVTSIIIWALSYFPGVSQKKYDEFSMIAQQNSQQIPSRKTLAFHNSYAAKIGQAIEPVFKPLGQNWKNSIALVTSVAGRTTIISTLITLYGIEDSADSRDVLRTALSSDPDFSRAAGIAMMVFVLLCGGCFASVMMFFNETKSVPYTSLFIAYPIVLAWLASSLFYFICQKVLPG